MPRLRLTAVPTLLLALMLSATAAAGEPAMPQPAKPVFQPAAEGDPFPDFVINAEPGDEWQLDAHPGQPKVIVFWATWCPYCKKLLPGIEALYEKYHDAGLQVLAVSFKDDGDPQQYASEHGFQFPVATHGDPLAATLGVTGTPTVFVLDRSDHIKLRTNTDDPKDPDLWKLAADLVETPAPAAPPAA